jgi:hypothetical protein
MVYNTKQTVQKLPTRIVSVPDHTFDRSIKRMQAQTGDRAQRRNFLTHTILP